MVFPPRPNARQVGAIFGILVQEFETMSRPTATGGSAIKAMDVLIESGVPQERIIFLNLVAAPEGLENVFKAHPSITVISAWVDDGLDENKYIIPGLGGACCTPATSFIHL